MEGQFLVVERLYTGLPNRLSKWYFARVRRTASLHTKARMYMIPDWMVGKCTIVKDKDIIIYI